MKRVAFYEMEKGQEFRLPRKTEVKAGAKMTAGMGKNDPGLVRWKKVGEQSYELVEWTEGAYSALDAPGVTLKGCVLSVSSPRVKVWVDA